jgi:hypothetical protein
LTRLIIMPESQIAPGCAGHIHWPTFDTPQDVTWADRAPLATLLGVIPKARRHRLRLLVTPDTILRWHRDIIRRRWAARSMHGRTGRPATRRTSGPWSSGWPARTPDGGIAGSMVNWPAWV